MWHPKELVVVLAIAFAIFAAAKPLCLKLMRSEDFALRRNVWFGLTICAFLAPNFWVYAGIALVVLLWAGRRDANPASLFLIAYAIIPPVTFDIPIVGINQLFPLSQPRIVALVVMLPLAIRLFAANEGGLARRTTALDWLLIGYIALQIVLITPYESATNTMRRAFLYLIDTLLVYYVFSRSMQNRRALLDSMASFVLVGALFAAIAIFESFKGWLMYEQIGLGWGAINNGAFLLRGDNLRAQVSAGHSLTLGYVLAMAFGVWLALRHKVQVRWTRWLTTALFCVGLYATHARGPWLAALLVYFVFLFVAPNGKTALFNGLAVFALLTGVVAVTPLGARIIDTLPFIGTVDQDNVTYRQRLAEKSWQLVWQNPVFGDPFVAMRMEDLRQGQGIIDLMNAYAAVALYYGFVGLTLFALFFVLSSARAYVSLRRLQTTAPELALVGAALVACMLGSLFFMATASIDWVEYVLGGMIAGYVALAARTLRSPVAATAAMPRAATSPLNPSFVLGKR